MADPCLRQEIDLGYNAFTGNLSAFARPTSYTVLPPTFQYVLRILRLDHNQLSGSIPSFPVGPLEIIDLSNNALTGTVPAYQSSTLSILRFAANNLSGPLPSDMELPNLEALSVVMSGMHQTELNSRGQYLPPYLLLDRCCPRQPSYMDVHVHINQHACMEATGQITTAAMPCAHAPAAGTRHMH